MKQILVILAIFTFHRVDAQIALVKDTQGFSNVRQSPATNSKVVDTLPNQCLVYVLEDGIQNNWCPVDYKKGNETRSGYVHGSRLQFLKSFEQFKPVKKTDSLLVLRYDNMEIHVARKKFNSTGRQLKNASGNGEADYVKYIDGKIPWGTDGNLPRNEYSSIRIKNGKLAAVSLPASHFKDLFEPNLEMTTASIDKESGRIYLEATNSDAAGAYAVVWVIQNGKVLERKTYIPF